MLSDQRLQRCEAVGAVDVDDDKAGHGTRCNPYVGVRPFAKPHFDLAGIGGRDLEAAGHAGMLAGVPTAISAAGASAILNGVQGEDL